MRPAGRGLKTPALRLPLAYVPLLKDLTAGDGCHVSLTTLVLTECLDLRGTHWKGDVERSIHWCSFHGDDGCANAPECYVYMYIVSCILH
jgi:hypothetical protein